MGRLLGFFFGAEATLKRETVIVFVGLIAFMIIRVFAFVPPEAVEHYKDTLDNALWPLVLTIAAIFGIQIAPVFSKSAQRVEETTSITSPSGQTIETTTKAQPARPAGTLPDDPIVPPGAAG